MLRLRFALVTAALLPLSLQAGIIRIEESAFLADAGVITFSEFGVNTTNPNYSPGDYGSVSGPAVSFGGYFIGQGLSSSPDGDCPGAAASACVVGPPSGPLSLDASSPNTFIAFDGANPTSPVLSGSPTFNGPIAALFGTDVAGVGFDGGFFDAPGSTAITAFARDGSLLGSVSNEGIGIEFLGLATDDGSDGIAGFFLDLAGGEPGGFAIDNVRFGEGEQIVIPDPPGGGGGGASVPAPASIALLGLGLAGVGWSRRKK